MTKIRELLPREQLDLFTPVQTPAPDVGSPTRSAGLRHRPRGDVYNLEEFFTVINRTVFKNALSACALRWSRNRWQATLAVCDVGRRAITVNRVLDDARIPEMVVASVVHHEMLHLYFGISETPRGQRYHTPQFRLAERVFPGYSESEKWIKENWPLRGRPAKKRRSTESSFLAYLALMYS